MPIPDFPTVSGHYRLTDEWTIDLPGRFSRRLEDDDLVLWRPGLTFWLAVWDHGPGGAAETRARLASEVHPDATARAERTDGAVWCLTYELAESDAERTPSEYVGVYALAVSPTSWLQAAAYADRARDLTAARQALATLSATPSGG